MKLTQEQAKEKILKPRNKTHIDQATFQEERLLLHGEALLEKYNLPFTAFLNFTTWWKSLISDVKYERIDQLMNCPLYTVGIIKDIFDDLQKFLDSQDRYVDFNFTDVDFTNDYNAFLKQSNDDDFWRSKVIENLKTGICSYVVVDLPAEQITERPEPYNYFVSPRMMQDVEINRFTGNVEYIIFRQPEFSWESAFNTFGAPTALSTYAENVKTEKVIVVDDECYRTYVFQSGKEWGLLSETCHDLGYCPVIDFWKESIKGSKGINKVGPITMQLSNLDYTLFFKACIDYMNLYGPFPLMVTYDMKTKEWDDKTKQVVGGTGAYARNQVSSVSNSIATQNPRTSGRNTLGPGGGFSTPVPADGNDHDFMKNPMKFVGMDVDNVKAANELLAQMEASIKEKCTGIDKNYLNEIAKNDAMIAASFRKEETILTWIKSNMERVHKFVTKAKCELRYGKEYFLGCTIDYGSDYLLKDAKTLSDEFKLAVDNGMPQGYSFEIANAAAITRFKNNPDLLARMRILFDLEPYSTTPIKDLKEMGFDIGDQEGFVIKANFNTFVTRFELECGDIVNFGSLIKYSEKIKTIQSKFKEYAKSINWSTPAPGTTGN